MRGRPLLPPLVSVSTAQRTGGITDGPAPRPRGEEGWRRDVRAARPTARAAWTQQKATRVAAAPARVHQGGGELTQKALLGRAGPGTTEAGATHWRGGEEARRGDEGRGVGREGG